MRLILCLFLFCLTTIPAMAQDAARPPEFHPTGLPLPRFASLKADKAYVRSGPGMQYPFEWVYRREGLPVEITQEFEQWRKIRDSDGAEGWVNAILLSGRRTALIKGPAMAEMREGGKRNRLIAKLEPGVITDLKKCAEESCLVATGGYSGWVARNSLWGIYDREEFN